MFGQPALGAILAMAHYASVLMVGLTFRFYARKSEPRENQEPGILLRGIHKRALEAMIRGRQEDGRRFGKVVNEAISESIGTLFMIMSFIVLFAVLLKVLAVTGLLGVVSVPFGALFHAVGISPKLVPAAVKGFFEIDLGSAAAAQAGAPLLQSLVVVSGIIAWSGLSVHGQVASVLADTDISMKPYFVARALHAIYAGLMTVVFIRPVEALMGPMSIPVFSTKGYAAPTLLGPMIGEAFHWSLLLVLMSLLGLALGAVMVGGLRFLRRGWLFMH